MKNLFKKSWFIGTLMISIILIVFLMNLWIMSVKLARPFDSESLWSISSNLSQNRPENIFAFILKIAFFISIIPILLSVFSWFKKHSWGFITAIIYFLVFDMVLFVFQSLYSKLSVFAIVLTIINIIFIVSLFVLQIFRNKVLDRTNNTQKSEIEIKLSQTKIPLSVLIIDIVSIVAFLTTFMIPLYTLGVEPNAYSAIILRVLFSGETKIEVIIYFLVNIVIFLSMFLYFAQLISTYIFDKETFINKSKTLVTFAFISTIVFFLTGLTIVIYHTISGYVSETVSFIPMLLMCIVIFIYAIFKGQYNAYHEVSSGEVKSKYARIEPLLYVFLLTAVTGLMLLLPIIKIQIEPNVYPYNLNLSGIDILKDYANLDPGYKIVAFMLVVMLISVGLCLVVALTSYISKYKQFNSIVKMAAMINVFFVFIIAISGYYFQIANEINKVVIADIINFYGYTLPDTFIYEYTIKTDAIYALIASLAVLIVMFLRKAFERDELILIDGNALSSNNASQNDQTSPLNGADDESDQPLDPCPSFTELDSRLDFFKKDLEKRKLLKSKETSLNALINFIVEYARNSRLHLSYTPEDIATFVSGLGASRLSILQGMSGTGKTSLPKIFSEAVFGNCEIIEVESSWKDKNELLGYYNEFSMKYTPKKFTLALYKAALNQEIFTFILLDEMNLSRIEYYFSDFLSLMENEEDQREIKLINISLNRNVDGKQIDYLALNHGNILKIPANVWFIGTANRDESTFVISDKVYDRAHTLNFTKRAPKVRNYSNPISKQYYDYQAINEMFIEAKQNGDFDAENNELIKSVEKLLVPFNISFGNRILKQIEDFVNIYKACFINEDVESEAIEKILLSKVVAKLEVKTIDDKDKLEMEFEKLNLKQCATFIRHLDNE